MRKFTSMVAIYLLLGIAFAFGQNNYGVYRETPVNANVPQGWLRRLLETQRDGLTGHIQVAGDPFDKDGWGPPKTKKMTDWAQYEQAGYWADGALRNGYLIGDDNLKNKVKEWIHYQISHADKNGFIGPKDISFLWPEVVFFRAVMAEYGVTHDRRIIDALKRNYHAPQYVSLNGAEGQDEFFKDRLILHVEMLCWLYQQTGDQFFLHKSEDAYQKFNNDGGQYSMTAMNADDVPRTHSVSYCENLKIPVLLYISTGKQKYLDAALNAVRKVYKYHGLVDGLPSGNELHDGNFSNEVHETCTATDMQWALGYLLQATGDAQWADLIEKICFNAGMGSVAKNFRSYQYYSGPNQVIADGLASHWNDHEPWYMNSRDRASFKINHRPSCCGGNINRMLPVFCSRMWMTRGNNGIAAALYSPSMFSITLPASKTKVTIEEETGYPFKDQVNFRIRSGKATDFSLWLRIPEWCKNAGISINGKKSDIVCKPGTFAELKRRFQPNDAVTLSLPMEVQAVPQPGNGIAFRRGPLIYSLPISAKTEIKNARVQDGIPFESTYKTPTSAWNFAPLDTAGIQVKEKGDLSNPWNPEQTPLQLELEAVKVKNWKLYRETYTPDLPSVLVLGEKQKITLIPLGATELRMTIFPDVQQRYTRSKANTLKF